VVAPAYVVRVLLVAALAATGVVASGCARPVAVQAPTATDNCAPVLSSAPIRVVSELQRETSPADAAAIAWGDPPIVLVCGVDFTVPPDAQILEVDGVAWVAQVREDGTVFTTVEADPVVQIRVPAAYRPEAEVLADLGSNVSIGDQTSDMS